MPNATESGLTIPQLQLLANDAQQTHRQIESVLASLTGSDEEAQWASEALENCGPPPAAGVRLIARLCAHRSELVASWACKLLARAGASAAGAEEQLIAALADRQETLVREEAAHALGQLGKLSSAARAALIAAASEGSPRLKRLANASLGG